MAPKHEIANLYSRKSLLFIKHSQWEYYKTQKLSHIKMGKEILTFGDIEIEKHKFYCYKSPTFKEDGDIDNILVFNKISSSEKNYKYFIGYLYDDYKIKLLHIVLPKRSAYVQSYDGQTKWMHFLIDLLEKYNTIWANVTSHIKKRF